MLNNSTAFNVFRGIYSANLEKNSNDTKVVDLAEKSAENKSNNSSITVALNDFSEKFKSFHNFNSSNITAKDAKKSFFSKKTDNIFSSKEGQKYLKEAGNLFQNDIFQQEINKNNGIKYSKEDENAVKSAIEFAKADIQALESAYSKSHVESFNDGCLNKKEILYYSNYTTDSYLDLNSLDLDGDVQKITAKEYASFLLAADSIMSFGKNDENVGFKLDFDGFISKENAELVKNIDDKKLKEKALEIYKTLDEYDIDFEENN